MSIAGILCVLLVFVLFGAVMCVCMGLGRLVSACLVQSGYQPPVWLRCAPRAVRMALRGICALNQRQACNLMQSQPYAFRDILGVAGDNLADCVGADSGIERQHARRRICGLQPAYESVSIDHCAFASSCSLIHASAFRYPRLASWCAMRCVMRCLFIRMSEMILVFRPVRRDTSTKLALFASIHSARCSPGVVRQSGLYPFSFMPA